MRADLSHLKQYRFVEQELKFGGSTGHPDAGILLIPSVQDRKPLKVIFSRGFYGWDHVSVSKQKHPPSWNEMNWLKSLFFEDDEAVMQLHPPKSEWISNHDTCLHMWRPVDHTIPMPPPELVGVKGVSADQMKKMSEDERFALQDKAIVNLDVQPGRNISQADVDETIRLVLEGKGESVSRQALVDVVLAAFPPPATDFEQAQSRLHRPGHKPEIVKIDVHDRYETAGGRTYRGRKAPNSPIQAMSMNNLSVRSLRDGAEGLVIVDEGHYVKGDTDRLPGELLEFQKQARRNLLLRAKDEEDRDDPINQMDEDMQALMDRDRE